MTFNWLWIGLISCLEIHWMAILAALFSAFHAELERISSRALLLLLLETRTDLPAKFCQNQLRANLPNWYSVLCWRPVTHAQTWASYSALYRFGRFSQLSCFPSRSCGRKLPTPFNAVFLSNLREYHHKNCQKPDPVGYISVAQYGSRFNHSDVIDPQSYQIWLWNNCHCVIQDHANASIRYQC